MALNRTRVLVGFAEALSAPEAVFSLLEAGYEILAFARRDSRVALTSCRSITVRRITAPEHDLESALADLNVLVREHVIDVVLPLDDASLAMVTLGGEATKDWVVAAAGVDAARVALDKSVQCEAARQAGLTVPATTVWETVPDPSAVERFPVVVKSALAAEVREGRLGRGPAFVAADRRELERGLDTLVGHQGPFLGQEMIRGVGEGIFGFMEPQGVAAWSAHRRVRMMNPQGSGSSACRSIPPDASLQEPITEFLKSIGWRGLFMIELLRDASGVPYFMELNGRSWGSMALARRRGLEYPAWAVGQRLAPSFRVPDLPAGRELCCRHLGREIVHLLMVMRGPRSEASRASWPSRWKTLLDVVRIRKSDRFYNWKKGEAPLFLRDTWATVADQVFKKAKRVEAPSNEPVKA